MKRWGWIVAAACAAGWARAAWRERVAEAAAARLAEKLVVARAEAEGAESAHEAAIERLAETVGAAVLPCRACRVRLKDALARERAANAAEILRAAGATAPGGEA